MAERSLADKMYRRTPDGPMSRRRNIDLLFLMQRHAVFVISPDSADHISNIIFAQQAIHDLDHIKKFEMMDEYHSEYDPRRSRRARAAPKLRTAIEQARLKWAEILRDEDLADVRIIVLPSEERDFEHIHPPVDVTIHPFGNQLFRFQKLKALLVEEGEGMPYRLKPRSGDSLTMELDLVIGREALERIATPQRQNIVNFKIHEITAPAARPSLEQLRSEIDILREDRASAYLNLENIVRVFRERSSTLREVVSKAPKRPWNYPYSIGGGRERIQPNWSGDNRPFSKDVYDLGSNSDWVRKDFVARAAQIDEWKSAKQARESALRTTEDYARLDGLARCNTYTADRNLQWWTQNLTDSVLDDYKVASKAANDAAIDFHQAKANWEALEAQRPQHREMIEYYRQVMIVQERVLERVKRHQEVISQGLPPAPPQRKKWDMPIRESHKLGMMNRPQPGTEMDFDEEPSEPEMAPGKAREDAPFAMAEPGHTPIPEIRRDTRRHGPTPRPLARPAPEHEDRRGRVPLREDVGSSKIRPGVTGYGNARPGPSRQSTDLARDGRTDLPARHPHIVTPVAKTPQISTNQAQHKLDAGHDAARKTRRQVSFRIPSPSNEPCRQGNTGKEPSSSNKETNIPKPAGPYASQSAGQPNPDQRLASARRVPSLIYNNEASFKSLQCPPAITPATPSDCNVREATFQSDENVAVRSLKLAVGSKAAIDHGSPQGRFPNLRRVVSGFAGGLP